MPATEEPIASPFTVLIDTNESQPWTFQNLRADAKDELRPLVVPTRYESLGRHPHALGDYSAEGLVGVAHVERKSLEDCQGTVLGWETEHERRKHLAGRRERFEKELENLSKIPYGIVIVEAEFAECLKTMPSWGKKSREQNAKIFARSVQAYMADYKTPWLFCDGRRLAEQCCYRWLFRAWRKERDRKKSEANQLTG